MIARALVATSLCLGAVAAPAGASISVPSFSVTPSTTQAGASPDMDLDVQLSFGGGDDVRDLISSLAPGLLSAPAVVPACSAAALQSPSSCPDASRVGGGTMTVTADPWAAQADYPATLYLVEPEPNEAGRLGLVVGTPFGRIVSPASVALRTSPDVGLDVAFRNLTRQVGGTNVTIDRIQLRFDGTVAGRPFTRNPTACTLATTRLRAVSHDAPGSPADAQSAFTPTGCELLAYAPALSASATIGAAQDVALTTTTTQADGEAATRRAMLALPPALLARPAALGRACTASDPATCPPASTVGSATATIPLLAAPLTGRVVLVSRGAALPGLSAVFPSPFPLRIDGTTALAPGGLTATLDPIPDVPIRNLEVRLDGGADSLFTAGSALCLGSPRLAGELVAHSGRTVQPSTPLAVSGCPPRPKPIGKLSFRGLGGGRPALRLSVTAPAVPEDRAAQAAVALKRVDVGLPRGLKVVRRKLGRGLSVKADGRRLRRAGRKIRRGLRIALPGGGARKLAATLRAPALRVSRGLARKVRSGKRVRLSVGLGVRDAAGKTARLGLRVRPR